MQNKIKNRNDLEGLNLIENEEIKENYSNATVEKNKNYKIGFMGIDD